MERLFRHCWSTLRLPLLFVVLAFTTNLSLHSQAQSNSSDILTNDSVLKLVKGGLSYKLIVQMIESHPGIYNTGPDSILVLKQQGVPEAVLSAMIAKKNDASATASPGRPEGSSASRGSDTNSSSNAPQGAWVINSSTNPMNDQREYSASMWQPATGGQKEGILQALATCSSEALSFKIAILGDSNKNLAFHRGEGLLGRNSTTAAVRLDSDLPYYSNSASEYINYTTVSFSNFFKPSSNRTSLLQLETDPGYKATTDAAGTLRQALAANTILIELPLNNDDKVILTIKPHDPSFLAFVAGCKSRSMLADSGPVPNKVSPSVASQVPSATEILNQVELRATASHKVILVDFGASWCIPCRAYERFIQDPKIRPILNKYLLLAHITIAERQGGGDPKNDNPGGYQLAAGFAGADFGIPYYAFVDPEGKKIATYNGYPATPADIRDFMAILTKQVIPSMTIAESVAIQSWLTRNGHN